MVRTRRSRPVAVLPFLVAACLVVLPWPAAADAAQSVVPLDDFSPAFLGTYRKVMEIEPQIARYARSYGVDRHLALAVCMYESGGNADLTSGAGARGYFQVMPSTFRLMHVPTNIEAGVKYLSQLVKQFGREDYALAAYNGGPTRVARGRAMPLESLQYVLGVGYYRSVLRMYEPLVRGYAEQLQLFRTMGGETWESLSQQLGIPVLQLKLHNPFLSDQRLARGTHLIAYPEEPRPDLIDVAADGSMRYRTRIGDNYFNLAFAFDVDVDAFRDANGLWRLQALPTGMEVRIPLDVPANASGRMAPVERASRTEEPPRPAFQLHRVRRAETLTAIARRYGTTVAAIQRASGLGRRTTIRVGERLRIPR